jgi:hypothetical protein
MSRTYFITFHNVGNSQNSAPSTIEISRSDAESETKCMNQRGPKSFFIEPKGTHLVVLIDNNGFGHCNGAEKWITWTYDDGGKKFSFHSLPLEGAHWKAWVQGQVVGAYCDGESCTDEGSPASGYSDPVTIDIFL